MQYKRFLDCSCSGRHNHCRARQALRTAAAARRLGLFFLLYKEFTRCTFTFLFMSTTPGSLDKIAYLPLADEQSCFYMNSKQIANFSFFK